MSEMLVMITEGALRKFIEEAVQSEDGMTDEDIRYIEEEREYIRLARAATA